MKKLLAICCLSCLTAQAAVVRSTISSLPQITTPSTNTYFEVADMSATPKSRKLSISDLKSSINATNLTLSVNATNATTPNLQDTATVTWAKSGSNLTATAAGSSASAPVNNFYATNIYSQTGNHNTMIITQYVRLPWTTLSYSNTNVSTIDLSAASVFKLTLTNDAFIGAPTGLPGTNLAQTIQLHLIQDGTGTRKVTMTNSAWILSGSGASTNAVPTINTNANGLTILTFVTSPFSSTLLYGVPTAFTP